MYLSNDDILLYVMQQTELSIDEIEHITGRFDSDHHSWPNKLKGEYIETLDGTKKIIHHFKKTTLWTNE